jgi:hypothetical protein
MDTRVINVIPHENQPVAIFNGQAFIPQPSEPGDPAVMIEGKRVPYEDLDQLYEERMLFDWRGGNFAFVSYIGGRVSGSYSGGDSSWAYAQGLAGGPYEGWTCNVPESEIENLRIERLDQLESWKYRRTFKVSPPHQLFRTVRPATNKEWVRD